MKYRPLFLMFVLIAVIGLVVWGVSMLPAALPAPREEPAVTPTPTSIVRSGPLVINAIRTHAKLETVIMSIVNDQDIVRVSGIGGLCTERIAYLGYYDVVAGVDLAKITEGDIVVVNDGLLDRAAVTVTIPPAEILNVVLDTQHSRIVAQDTPKWIPGCETQVADMTVEAQQIIQQYAERAAIERGILKLAQEKAGFELQRLLLETGYWNVAIRYGNGETMPAPEPALTPVP